MTKCNCGDSRVKVVETRQQQWRGTVYRRLQCLGCGERRTVYDVEPPNHDKPRGKKSPPLSPDQVRFILTSSGTMTSIAKEVGTSRQVVANVLRGDRHRNICRKDPRPLDRGRPENHGTCVHWRGFCGLELPDAIEEGQAFCGFCPAHHA
jgi:hypothetical protein